MSIKILLIMMVTTPLLFSCTSRQLYNAVQQNRLQDCRQLADTQRKECEAQYQKDYDTYEQQRQQVLTDKTK